MDPKTSTGFLSKASKVIDRTRRANQRIRPNRDTVLPHDIRNPLEVATGTTYRQKNGYGGKKSNYEVVSATTENVREKENHLFKRSRKLRRSRWPSWPNLDEY